MLSYRHAYHAGNHADVLKHAVLVACLRYLNEKDKPYWYIDTHAGAGAYALDKGYAAQNAEHESGIARLWGRRDLPAPLQDYVDIVRSYNRGGRLGLYPGSPLVARRLLRADDRMRLFELHSTDAKLLAKKAFADASRQVIIEAQDGFRGLKALLPPPTRRALVLIDPPYEVKTDYEEVVETIADSLKRFAGGVYAVWYPLLQTGAARRLPEKLRALAPPAWLDVSLTVKTPQIDGFGMHGSGLFIVNPPWTLPALLTTIMPYLVDVLGEDDGAAFGLEQQLP